MSSVGPFPTLPFLPVSSLHFAKPPQAEQFRVILHGPPRSYRAQGPALCKSIWVLSLDPSEGLSCLHSGSPTLEPPRPQQSGFLLSAWKPTSSQVPPPLRSLLLV